MKLIFLGAAHEVTGSCTLLTVGEKKILIDCGMEQGADTFENCEMPVSPADVDAVLLTHAHVDHSGKLPALVAGGFRGPIFATSATCQLCGIMLRDCAHIQESEAKWRNRKAERAGKEGYVPLYTMAEAEKTLSLMKPCRYEEHLAVSEGITARFFDAGHLLGSASIELEVEENGEKKTLLFSGDIGNVSRPLIRDPQRPQRADVVVIESTYGDRLHGPRHDYRRQLCDIIGETLDRGGNVIIPSFAVGRTQELLYLIHGIKQQNLLPRHRDFPVWVDSPMAVEATRIYSGQNGDMWEYYDEETRALLQNGENILQFPGLHTAVTSEESIAINADPTPKVILSASGMCEAGRIRHHLKHNLWRPESTVLFVGYQSQGSLGRLLLDGAPQVKLFGETIQVRARIAQMEGISGHADRDMLLHWLAGLSKAPQMVYVNHGDNEVCEAFVKTIGEILHFPAAAPYNGAGYDLIENRCLYAGNQTPIDKKAAAHRKTQTVYERLLAAGRRLMTVIEHNRGGANKELARFTDQILSLCEKWDR